MLFFLTRWVKNYKTVIWLNNVVATLFNANLYMMNFAESGLVKWSDFYEKNLIDYFNFFIIGLFYARV